MDDIGNVVVCPGCGKRYSLSDFRDDKLVCSACGREIPRFISVGAVDEAKYVKQYLKRMAAEDRFPVIVILVFVGLLCWVLTLRFSLWWKIPIGFFAIMMPIVVIKMVAKNWQVRRIFRKNGYRLAESVRCFRQWHDALGKDEKGFIDKDKFIKELENYIQSHAEIERSYGVADARNAATGPSRNAPPSTYRFVIAKEQRIDDVYDYPPERCPGCGKLYGVADFATDNVQCRHCGKLIKIKCRVSDAEMQMLWEQLAARIKKDNDFSKKLFRYFMLISPLIIIVQIAVVGLDRYFSSWHALTMLFPVSFSIMACMDVFNKPKQILKLALEGDISNIVAIEFYIKEYADCNSSISDAEKALAEFKKSLFDLYRSKGKVIGRY